MKVSFLPLEKTLEYADVSMLEHVRLCDTITVEYRQPVKAKVIKTVYNVLREVYVSIEVGDARATFAETVTNDTPTKQEVSKTVSSAVQQASARLNELVQNASGLYSTADVQPDGSTIYYLHDKKTLGQSQLVMKLTSSVIGFSTDGGRSYPYGFTINGEMVMQIISTEGLNAGWINSGELNAALIKAGILQSDDGETFYLDLDKGVLRMKAESLSISGKTVDQIAQSKATAAVDGQTQTDIFNKLTNDGKLQGLYMKDGQLYINASYLKSGELSAALIKAGILQSDDGETFYLDLDKGVLRMKAESLSISGKTVDQIAQGKVDAQTQTSIFNKLTNNGKLQGLYMEDGNLYVNASYLKAGVIDLELLKLAGTVCGLMQGFGATKDGKTTQGIVIYGNGVDTSGYAKPPYILVTNAGFRVQLSNDYSFDFSGGNFNVLGNILATKSGNQQGNIRADGNVTAGGSVTAGGNVTAGGKLAGKDGELNAQGIWIGKELPASCALYAYLNSSEGVSIAGWSSASQAVWVGAQGRKLVLHCSELSSDAQMTVTSDRKAKKDIQALEEASPIAAAGDQALEGPSADGVEEEPERSLAARYEAVLDAMTPVRFRYRSEADGAPYHLGYIAQDVERALAAGGMGRGDMAAVCETVDENGETSMGLAYGEIIALLHLKIRSLEKRLTSLEAFVTDLTEQKGVNS